MLEKKGETDNNKSKGVTRRDFVKKTAAAGGAVVIDSLTTGSNMQAQEAVPIIKEPPKYYEEGISPWVKRESLDFETFPKHLGFAPGKFFLAVNRKWQISTLYNPDGSIHMKDGEPFQILSGTGRQMPDRETRTGFFQIERQNEADYTSGKYYVSGGTTPMDKEDKKAPMPWAQHIGIVKRDKVGNPLKDKKGNFIFEDSDGTALHGSGTTGLTMLKAFRSHSCVRLQRRQAEYLRKVMSKGDYVGIFDDEKVLKDNKSIEELTKKLK